MHERDRHVGRRRLRWFAVLWASVCFAPLLVALRDPSFRSDPESVVVGAVVLGLSWIAGAAVILFIGLVFVE